jgi:ribonuclease PH
LVEVQATAERTPFPRSRLLEMMDLAETGIRQLLDAQRKTMASAAR